MNQSLQCKIVKSQSVVDRHRMPKLIRSNSERKRGKPRMNIVFVTYQLASRNISSDGVASFSANIARIFAENGHRVFIVLASTKELHVEFQEDINLISLYVPMEKWIKMDKISKVLCRICKESEDVIRRTLISFYKSRQVRKVIRDINRKNSVDIILYCTNRMLSRFSPKGIPYVARISSFFNVWEGADIPGGSVKYEECPLSLKDKLEEYGIKNAKYVVAPSHLLAGMAKENIGLDVTVIESPFVLKTDEWDDSVLVRMRLNEKKYIIHYAGSLRYFKGTHVVAMLAKKFLQKYPDYYIVLAGKSREMIDENGNKMQADEFVKKGAGEFSDRVLYAGSLVREQLYPLIQNAELCLLPSRVENLANACIEAMAMGKIVVATNGASYEQLIDDRVSGFLCERDNPDSYLYAINEALNMSAEEKEKMVSRALEVAKRLEPQKIYKQYLNLFEKAIQGQNTNG